MSLATKEVPTNPPMSFIFSPQVLAMTLEFAHSSPSATSEESLRSIGYSALAKALSAGVSKQENGMVSPVPLLIE